MEDMGARAEGTDFRLTAAGEVVRVRSDAAAGAGTIVYLHAFEDDGGTLWRLCRKAGCRDLALATVAVPDWDGDLTPWPAPAVFKRATAFGGRGPGQLARLEDEIMPAVEARLGGSEAPRRIIAGYSLAGLFAAWAALESSAFDGFASVSGSLWYPGFVQYVAGHEMPDRLRCGYFSLGEREAATRNEAMAQVLDATRAIERDLRGRGLATTLEMNPGTHFDDEAPRCAKGIRWALEHAR